MHKTHLFWNDFVTHWNSLGRGCTIDDGSAFVASNDPIDISVFGVES